MWNIFFGGDHPGTEITRIHKQVSCALFLIVVWNSLTFCESSLLTISTIDLLNAALASVCWTWSWRRSAYLRINRQRRLLFITFSISMKRFKKKKLKYELHVSPRGGCLASSNSTFESHNYSRDQILIRGLGIERLVIKWTVCGFAIPHWWVTGESFIIAGTVYV